MIRQLLLPILFVCATCCNIVIAGDPPRRSVTAANSKTDSRGRSSDDGRPRPVNEDPQASTINTQPWDKIPAKFIMSMTADHQGRIWVGTEDDGVFVYDPKTDKTTQFTTKNGLAENYGYAIACDSLGRIWAGHQTRGVSVYNGERWQNYEVVAGLSDKATLSGPLGERVFKIAVTPPGAPNAGDVWIGTNLGLSRYSPTTDTWSYFTRAEGLASDQINAIAIDDEGTVYAGTACDGLCIAGAKDGYKKWRTVVGPLRPTLTPTGSGLPSALINDILIARDGSVWVATDFGIAVSKNHGQSWSYVRGADWQLKVNGLYGGAPKGWEPIEGPTLLEDYATCLAEGAAGHLWIGHRQKPWEMIDVVSGRRVAQGNANAQEGKALNYVDCFCKCMQVLPDRSCLVGTYLEGVKSVAPQPIDPQSKPAVATKVFAGVANGIEPRFPSGVKALTPPQLAALTVDAQKKAPVLTKANGVLLSEDWATKGDWVGRYGRQYAVLCAADSPLNHYVKIGYPYEVRGMMGPHTDKGDSLRHWVEWTTTTDPRSLWDPCVGHRRQAEWDDHGESYPMHNEGPDIWAVVDVPEGLHKLSLYFFNKDGHAGANPRRDFLVELRQWKPDYAAAEAGPPLAHSRVVDFWGGTYKCFAVAGPSKFLVKISRNYSFNTIVSAVMLDRLEGPPHPLDSVPMAWMGNLPYGPPAASAEKASSAPLRSSKIVETRFTPESHAANILTYRSQAARSAKQGETPDALRWRIPLWTAADRTQFDNVMASAWAKMCDMNPELVAFRKQ